VGGRPLCAGYCQEKGGTEDAKLLERREGGKNCGGVVKEKSASRQVVEGCRKSFRTVWIERESVQLSSWGGILRGVGRERGSIPCEKRGGGPNWT